MQKSINIFLVIIIVALVGWTLIKPTGDSELATSPSPSPENINNNQPQESSPMPKKQYEKAQQVIKAGKSYTAILKTSAGDITVELAKNMPITVNNFVFLAKDKFYDGVIFHRTISGFMIQGGDPTGTGMGGPGYKFADEKFTGEYKRGTIAMANSGPNTNGSQFFIMHADYPLPPSYTIFGMTTSGLDVVDKIAAAKTGVSDRPVEPVIINTIEIIEK